MLRLELDNVRFLKMELGLGLGFRLHEGLSHAGRVVTSGIRARTIGPGVGLGFVGNCCGLCSRALDFGVGLGLGDAGQHVWGSYPQGGHVVHELRLGRLRVDMYRGGS